MEEAVSGYPLHRYLAWGHLAEAASECIESWPELAAEIRDSRKAYQKGADVDIMHLIQVADALLASEDIVAHHDQH